VAVDSGQQRRAVDRLDQVFGEARGPTARPVGRLSVAGQRDQRRRLRAQLRAQAGRQLVPVHDRQADVDDRQIGDERRGELQRLRAVEGRPHLVTEAAQELGRRSSAGSRARSVRARAQAPCRPPGWREARR
jgi:hypothetical protein